MSIPALMREDIELQVLGRAPVYEYGRSDIKVVDISADGLSHELGSDKVANIILIGEMLDTPEIMEIIKKNIPDVFGHPLL
ncbi:MAG: hypothetical protein ACOX68_07770 [Candidatus Limivicinus sp.]|jgi:hypothetical protein